MDPDIRVVLMSPYLHGLATKPYGDDTEGIPFNIPEARELGFIVMTYCDADNEGDLATRRSRTDFIVYLNNSPIHWMSKKKASVETSSYVSEFTALEHCCEYPRQLRYKLRMMGIPCEFPSFDYGDNKSVLANSSVPHSTLKKKSCSISYYFIREGLSNDDWRIAYVKSDNNRPDPPSKPLPGSMKREQLTGMLLNQVCT